MSETTDEIARLTAERDALRKALDEATADMNEMVARLVTAKSAGIAAATSDAADLARRMADEHRARAARRIGDAARRFEEGAADALDALRRHLEGGER